MARVQTAEKTFIFDLNPTNEADLSVNGAIIDCAQIHSLCNRVSARQGREYVVQSLEIGVQAGGAFEACIMRLPEHWPCINAWEKTMRHWLEQQNETLEEGGLESRVAKYRDFKIFFDANHANAGTGANLIPSGYSITPPATGGYDWNPSQVVVPNDGGIAGNTQEYYLHMMGADNAGANPSKGMILAYAESRTRPFNDDPNIVDVISGGLFGEMEDVGEITGAIAKNAVGANDQPPYVIDVDTADEYYPGGANQGFGGGTPGAIPYSGQFVDIISVNAGQNYNTDTCPGFVAPCGLIQINYNATGANIPGVPQAGDMPFGLWAKLILAPGEYKGLLTQSMQEAN